MLEHYTTIMKTIAISIDELTLKAIDDIANPAPAAGGRGRRGGPRGGRSRSAVLRQFMQEAVARLKKAEQEARERRALAKHRARLARQAKALIAEQAKP
jgi:hypothetical protein